MLRRRGLTPLQLRQEYEYASQLPHGEVNLVELFGEPPYEFLGEVPGRDFPNYADFDPQFVDDLGRQYQATDERTRFFVRIPLSITRAYNADHAASYEDYVGFPDVGDDVRLVGNGVEIRARVLDCPFQYRRAVSNVFVDITSIRQSAVDNSIT